MSLATSIKLIKDLSAEVKQDCKSAILSPQVFEPSELEKGMLTSKDSEIKNADVPERFQVSCESNNRLFVKDLRITLL